MQESENNKTFIKSINQIGQEGCLWSANLKIHRHGHKLYKKKLNVEKLLQSYMEKN